MLTLYTWTTPNGRKISILLEELGLAYQVQTVNLGKNEQFAPEFLAISPNNKIPGIVDHAAEGGPLALFESGAILTYLAEKHGRFLAPSGHARYEALAWLHWQIGNLGPMLGQFGFFAVRAQEKSQLAIERFTDEAGRLFGVMEHRLQAQRYLGGNEYSIADIACYPWMQAARTGMHGLLQPAIEAGPALCRWMDEVGARPAVQRGVQVPQV